MGIPEKINILHLNTAHTWRGGENQVFNLVSGLEKYTNIRNILACPKDSPLFNKTQKIGILTVPVNFNGEFNQLPIFKLIKIVSKFNIQIIHSHTSHALLFGCLIRLLKPQIKHLTTRRVDFHTHKNPISLLKYHILTDLIIAISKGIEKVLISDGIKPQKITTIYSGMDFSQFESVGDSSYLYSELKIPKNNLIVINIASLADHKAQKYLIEAMNTVVKFSKKIRLLIVGEGKLYKDLKNQIEKHNLQKWIIMTGFRKDIPNLLKISDIFVLSSYLEGLGTSLIESMRMKVPIIATEVGGIPEIVKDGDNGILVPPRNPEAIANAIIKLANDEKLRYQMGNKGLLISQNFSTEKMVNEYYSIYKRLCHTG